MPTIFLYLNEVTMGAYVSRLLLVLLAVAACSTTSSNVLQEASPEASPETYKDSLPDLQTYKAISGHPHRLQRDVVKFTIDVQDQENTLFQNTSRYEFHLPFLNEHHPRYRKAPLDLESYTAAIYGQPPEAKALTAGQLIWSDRWQLTSQHEMGTMVFIIYLGGPGATADAALYSENFAEIRSAFLSLKSKMPFIGDRLAFPLPMRFRFGDRTVRQLFNDAQIPIIYINARYEEEFLATDEDGQQGDLDLFAELPPIDCPSELPREMKRSQVDLGTLAFALDYCVPGGFLSTPGTSPFKLFRAILLDSNANVDATRRGLRQIIVPDETPNYSAVLVITHHNGCDQLSIVTPDGKYEFENAALDPGTITQDRCGDHRGNMTWKIRYLNQENPVEGATSACLSIYQSCSTEER